MPSPKPWTVRSSRTVVADRWIDLRAETVVNGKGVTLDPFYVLHYADWVHVFAVTPEGMVVLTEQYRHGTREIGLELPGGVIDRTDPDPASAARRELLEETGFAAGRLRPVAALASNPATHSNRVHTFLATDCRALQAQALDEGEDIAVHLVPIQDLMPLIQAGRISQSMHVASILLSLAALDQDRSSTN
jgi:8-oxo-dGTP pyrophosphatase MutT (NUDIX family)